MKNLVHAVTLFFTISLITCSEDKPTGPPRAFTVNSIPVSVGQRWNYQVTERITNIVSPLSSDSLLILIGDTVVVTQNSSEVIGLAMSPDSVELFVFESFDGCATQRYYGVTDSGIFLYGVSATCFGVGVGLLREVSGNGGSPKDDLALQAFALPFLAFESEPFAQALTSSADSHWTLVTPPRMSYELPIVSGSSWLVGGPNDWAEIEKKVGAPINVKVPAGTYRCFELTWQYDLDRDGDWDDFVELSEFISSVGVIKHVVDYGRIERRSENGDSLYAADFSTTVELVSITSQ